MFDLDAMLKHAAAADAWTRVVHRCAWCDHFIDERGEYTTLVVLDDSTVVTDGMCPRCAARALGEITTRTQTHRAA